VTATVLFVVVAVTGTMVVDGTVVVPRVLVVRKVVTVVDTLVGTVVVAVTVMKVGW
jgi:hypothetical protein